jgi:hypothetical protein
MMFTPGTRYVAASLALAALVGLAAAEPRDATPPKARLPFRCSTEEWRATFEVKQPTYDRSTGKLTWVLEAKKDTRLGKYEAFVTDANAVEAATLDVSFTPKQAEYKAKAKVTATVMLTHVDAEDVCDVRIRLKR